MISTKKQMAATMLALLMTGPAIAQNTPQTTAKTSTGIQEFTTDGCSLFPDRAPGGTPDWCDCCVQHDVTYWRGGTEEDRLQADIALRECVQNKSGSPQLAQMMYNGVRVGGDAALNTSFRWGYGWPYGRGYRALNAEEQQQAAQAIARYRQQAGAMQCPSKPVTLPVLFSAGEKNEYGKR